MATFTVSNPHANGAFTLMEVTLSGGDTTSNRIELPGQADRSIHAAGNFGTGGTVVVEGSNHPDPTVDGDWAVLSDGVDNLLSFLADGIKNIAENCRWYRVRLLNPAGAQVDVRIFNRRTT